MPIPCWRNERMGPKGKLGHRSGFSISNSVPAAPCQVACEMTRGGRWSDSPLSFPGEKRVVARVKTGSWATIE
ncbi:MAG: hypothetical protein CM1200mP2_42400 [Planctomycetaceae bacterium]|nr:MAG: hypothetical protein CM1200mP2_42400 [Planctomycetaceae bacterium]